MESPSYCFGDFLDTWVGILILRRLLGLWILVQVFPA
jgi:hypothetical protein